MKKLISFFVLLFSVNTFAQEFEEAIYYRTQFSDLHAEHHEATTERMYYEYIGELSLVTIYNYESKAYMKYIRINGHETNVLWFKLGLPEDCIIGETEIVLKRRRAGWTYSISGRRENIIPFIKKLSEFIKDGNNLFNR